MFGVMLSKFEITADHNEDTLLHALSAAMRAGSAGSTCPFPTPNRPDR